MSDIIVFYGIDKGLVKKKVSSEIKQKEITEKFDLEETPLSDVIVSAATYSMFDSEKIIICENSFFLTGKKVDYNIDPLLKYIESTNSNTTLIFTVNAEKLDKRKKIVKILEKNFQVKKCVFSEKEQRNFIKEYFENKNYKIDNESINLIIDRVGNNQLKITNELKKLELYKINKKIITKNDIKEVISEDFSNSIFTLIDLLVKKETKKAYELYKELVKIGEEPLKIFIMLANQYRLIYQVGIFSNNKYSEKEIAKILKKHPYSIKLAKQKSYLYSNSQIKRIITEMASLDLKIKSGKTDKNEAIDLFILTI